MNDENQPPINYQSIQSNGHKYIPEKNYYSTRASKNPLKQISNNQPYQNSYRNVQTGRSSSINRKQFNTNYHTHRATTRNKDSRSSSTRRNPAAYSVIVENGKVKRQPYPPQKKKKKYKDYNTGVRVGSRRSIIGGDRSRSSSQRVILRSSLKPQVREKKLYQRKGQEKAEKSRAGFYKGSNANTDQGAFRRRYTTYEPDGGKNARNGSKTFNTPMGNKGVSRARSNNNKVVTRKSPVTSLVHTPQAAHKSPSSNIKQVVKNVSKMKEKNRNQIVKRTPTSGNFKLTENKRLQDQREMNLKGYKVKTRLFEDVEIKDKARHTYDNNSSYKMKPNTKVTPIKIRDSSSRNPFQVNYPQQDQMKAKRAGSYSRAQDSLRRISGADINKKKTASVAPNTKTQSVKMRQINVRSSDSSRGIFKVKPKLPGKETVKQGNMSSKDRKSGVFYYNPNKPNTYVIAHEEQPQGRNVSRAASTRTVSRNRSVSCSRRSIRTPLVKNVSSNIRSSKNNDQQNMNRHPSLNKSVTKRASSRASMVDGGNHQIPRSKSKVKHVPNIFKEIQKLGLNDSSTSTFSNNFDRLYGAKSPQLKKNNSSNRASVQISRQNSGGQEITNRSKVKESMTPKGISKNPYVNVKTNQPMHKSNSEVIGEEVIDHEYYIKDMKKALKNGDPEDYFQKLSYEHFKQVHQTFAAFHNDPAIESQEIQSRLVYLPKTGKYP